MVDEMSHERAKEGHQKGRGALGWVMRKSAMGSQRLPPRAQHSTRVGPHRIPHPCGKKTRRGAERRSRARRRGVTSQ